MNTSFLKTFTVFFSHKSYSLQFSIKGRVLFSRKTLLGPIQGMSYRKTSIDSTVFCQVNSRLLVVACGVSVMIRYIVITYRFFVKKQHSFFEDIQSLDPSYLYWGFLFWTCLAEGGSYAVCFRRITFSWPLIFYSTRNICALFSIDVLQWDWAERPLAYLFFFILHAAPCHTSCFIIQTITPFLSFTFHFSKRRFPDSPVMCLSDLCSNILISFIFLLDIAAFTARLRFLDVFCGNCFGLSSDG